MSTRDYTTSHSAAPTYHAISSAEVSQARAASINTTANTTPHSTKRNSLNLSLGRRKIQITWQLHHRKRRPPCLKLLAVLHLHVRVLPRRNPIGLNGSPRGQERRESAERRRGCQSISVIPVQSSSHATKGSNDTNSVIKLQGSCVRGRAVDERSIGLICSRDINFGMRAC